MNAVSLPRLRILILAAGFSSRLGQPKALARVRGVSLLRRTIRLASGYTSAQIVVVVPRTAARYRIEASGFRVAFCINPQPARGLSSSVRCGISRARYSSAVLLLPVDLVNLRRDDVLRLISRWQGAPRRVAARRIGRRGGTPLILPRRLYLQALQITGDRGLGPLIDELPRESVRLVDLPSAEQDIDTPQDLSAARRRRGR
jgi:molybdenum cofactor cytidylyltransferase